MTTISELCPEIFEPPKLADFNVLHTQNRQTGIEMIYFIRKHRVVDVWGTQAFGGNITGMQLTLNCDHVVEKNGENFKVIKCRAASPAVVLRLMAAYLDSI